MHPTKGRITQHYLQFPQASGQNWPHTGTDYAGKIGDEVVSIAPGTVLFAGWGKDLPFHLCNQLAFVPGSNASGIQTVLQHDGWISASNHLNETHLNVGNKVSRGQRIGSVGNTGNTQGSHLHYEVISQLNVWSPPFGRYNPLDQIAHEDALASKAKGKVLTVTANVGIVRTSPEVRRDNVSSKYPQGLAKGAKVLAVGYVQGQDPYPNDGKRDDAWVKTVSGLYIWANGVGNNLSGLSRL